MNTSNNTSIISKFITKEIEHIYQRYNSIPEDELNKVKQFIEILEKNHLKFDPYRSYAATKATAEICDELEDIDIIRLYLFILDDLGLDIKAEDIKETYMDLIEKGYCKILGYYLYKNEETMKELARDELDCKLDDTEQGEEGYTDSYGDMIYYSLTGEEV